MVSLWPWRSDGTSPASFEKTLSALSAKITATQTQLDKTRSTSRRLRVLWTLYLVFAYLVYSIVLLLVVGLKNFGLLEWAGLVGGPLAVYLVRAVLSSFFNLRIDTLSSRLQEQQAERSRTIQKLKDATKYDSTLELLEKYGGSENKPTKKEKGGPAEGEGKSKRKLQNKPGAVAPNRTSMPPPPTANIPRGGPHQPSSPDLARHNFRGPLSPESPAFEPTAEFAPNAFGPAGAASYYDPSQTSGSSHWYDRILDSLLGEDETAARNRIALICSRCRLVNGQAPPGTGSLVEVGSWKCMGCGAENNAEAEEGKRIVREVLAAKGGAAKGEEMGGGDDDAEEHAVSSEEGHQEGEDLRPGEEKDGKE